MSEYKLINGWSKLDLINKIETDFKGKSVAENGRSCLYRGLDGKKCAVGLFIPDELYNPAFENRSFFWITMNAPDLLNFMPMDAESMNALQWAHDKSKIETSKAQILKWIDTNIKDGV